MQLKIINTYLNHSQQYNVLYYNFFFLLNAIYTYVIKNIKNNTTL